MKKADYPQRMCKEAVWSLQAYPCELVDQHPGPCASLSVAVSVEARERWEAANPGWEDKIGSMDIIVEAPTPDGPKKPEPGPERTGW